MTSNFIKTDRILSLDVFRGLTIVLMVLVNSQGTRVIYPILEHSPWNGCSLADLVFPFFLFIVGVTTVVSLERHIKQNTCKRAHLYRYIFKRAILLFVLGILINAYPNHFDFATLRVYGILQRIAMCYLICSIIYLNTSITTQIGVFFGILIGYWYFITQIPIPISGGALEQLSMANNWVGYIDKQIFSPAHLLKGFEPEGLLGTIPSIASTLSGILTGSFLLATRTKQNKCMRMVVAGILFILAGWLWSYSFPINKSLWTSTFVLWTSGWALIVLALCFYSIDISGHTQWALPFKIFGMNALFLFYFHVFLLKTQAIYTLPLKNGTSDSFRVVISEYLFGKYGQENAGLFYALIFLLLNSLVAVVLYRRKLFIKI